jgi:hypothetical protein
MQLGFLRLIVYPKKDPVLVDLGIDISLILIKGAKLIYRLDLQKP